MVFQPFSVAVLLLRKFKIYLTSRGGRPRHGGSSGNRPLVALAKCLFLSVVPALNPSLYISKKRPVGVRIPFPLLP